MRSSAVIRELTRIFAGQIKKYLKLSSNAALKSEFEDKAIPDNLHGMCQKWLRFYLDFCKKYHVPSKYEKNLPLPVSVAWAKTRKRPELPDNNNVCCNWRVRLPLAAHAHCLPLPFSKYQEKIQSIFEIAAYRSIVAMNDSIAVSGPLYNTKFNVKTGVVCIGHPGFTF